MKRLTPILWTAAAALAFVLLVPGPGGGPRHIALGGGSVVTLMNAQSVAGVGSSSITAQVTPTENGADTITFQFHGVGEASARIEISVDGTNWTPLYRFRSADDIFRAPVCGPCAYRALALYATATDTVTVSASISGTGLPFAPTYTPTSTPTATPT